VRTSGGSRLVVGCRPKIERTRLKAGSRVTLDMSTFTIMSILPREVDPNVHNMQAEDPGNIGYNEVGGLTN
jgi:26S proteasome regulatory subunit T4